MATTTAVEANIPARTRTHSESTSSSFSVISPVPNVSPEPIYIAASAASQIVTTDHDSRIDQWFDQHGIEPSGETALVAPEALRLVNSFLDHLLYNFLVVSRSTSLASLRPAVHEVLKPKLARDAVSGADQELHEYLGGGEDEELLAFHNGYESSGEWDHELVWKRTRLRCMVYSSLGDMEEEDEELYEKNGEHVEQSSRDGSPGNSAAGVVSPAVAIFLTSVLEFMGEQALIVAGQTAYTRLQRKYARQERDGAESSASDLADRVVVEESDMEKVAGDRVLGRLWRGWRKRVRSPKVTRPSSPNSAHSQDIESQSPTAIIISSPERPSIYDVLDDHEEAAKIPLPIDANDVKEIETPWLRLHPDDESPRGSVVSILRRTNKRRPKSLMVFGTTEQGLPTPDRSEPSSPTWITRRDTHRLSVPSPTQSDSEKRDTAFVTASKQDIDETLAPTNVSSELEDAKDSKGEEILSTSPTTAPENEETGPSGLMSGIVAGVAAAGAVAIAGIAAVAQGSVPQSDPVPVAEKDHMDDAIEEAEIMTSSRVSIGGRVSPDRIPLSRHSSVRSISVHSLRLVDVAGPRSPARTRNSSIDTSDHTKLGARNSFLVQRTLSTGTVTTVDVPRIASPIQRASTASPTMRHGANGTAKATGPARTSSAMSVRHARSSADGSISEIEESPHEDSEDDMPLAVPERSPYRDSRLFQRTVSSSSIPLPSATVSPIHYSEPQFVYSAIPATPTQRAGSGLTPTPLTYQPSRSLDGALTSLGTVHRNDTIDSGAPPLTPLRELVELAQGSEDDASSIAPSHASSSDLLATSRVQELSKENAPLSRYNTAQRTSPPQREDDVTPRPEDYIRAARQVHTSDSAASTNSAKIRAVRSSEESEKSGKGKSFEDLIQSDQTIQYTLTPQKIALETIPASARSSAPQLPQLPSAASLASNLSTTSMSSSIQRSTGLSSNPPQTSAPRFSEEPRLKPTSPLLTSVAKGVSSPQNVKARQPRADKESLGDLADFIRSTGPIGVNVMPKSSAPPQVTHRANTSSPRSAAKIAKKAPVVTPISVVEPVVKRNTSSAGKARLQARDAAVGYGGQSSDLIEFIRQGPPSSTPSQFNPRTTRQVAAAISNDRFSQASTDTVQPSMHSSVTSQSALLNNNYTTARSGKSDYNAFSEERGPPARKTRRVLDPYAIPDSDDDDDDLLFAEQTQPVRAEESLMDFLNSGPPSMPGAKATPSPPVVQQRQQSLLKKASNASLMSRFSRKESISSPAPSQSARGTTPRSGVPSHTPIAARTSSAYGTNPTASTAATNDYPTSTAASLANFMTADRSTSNVPTNSNPSFSTQNKTRVAQKQFQPRAPVVGDTRYKSSTSELADFLMNTPPPPGMAEAYGRQATNGSVGGNAAVAAQVQRQDNGLRGIFGRKKKTAAV